MAQLVQTNGKPINGDPVENLIVPKGTVNNNGNAVTAALKALELIDPDKIQALDYRVLLMVTAVDELTTGGLFKPESVIEKEQFNKTHATFISAGSEAFTDSNGDPIGNRPKRGDKVITTKYAGNVYRDKDNNLYRFCNDKDVVAIVEAE